jgi:hypothetical protein
MGKQDDAKAARLVQASMQKATAALSAGQTDQALATLKSTDELCERVEAPPPLHALVVRMYTDAARKKVRFPASSTDSPSTNQYTRRQIYSPSTFDNDVGHIGTFFACYGFQWQATPEVYVEVRASLTRVVAKNEEAEYRPGIPKEVQTDLRARLAELLANWGEMEREAGDYGTSAIVLEKAVQTFRRMGDAWEYATDFLANSRSRYKDNSVSPSTL